MCIDNRKKTFSPYPNSRRIETAIHETAANGYLPLFPHIQIQEGLKHIRRRKRHNAKRDLFPHIQIQEGLKPACFFILLSAITLFFPISKFKKDWNNCPIRLFFYKNYFFPISKFKKDWNNEMVIRDYEKNKNFSPYPNSRRIETRQKWNHSRLWRTLFPHIQIQEGLKLFWSWTLISISLLFPHIQIQEGLKLPSFGLVQFQQIFFFPISKFKKDWNTV